jgi:NitT/TauT family transport system substrate-binding protein
MRHRLLTLVLVVAVGLAAAPLAPAAEVVKMGDLPAISNAGYYLAIDKGYFAEKGIAVELERFASGGKMMAPLATGQLDIAVGAPSAGLYNSTAAGMDFKVIADKGQVRPGASFIPIIVRQDLIDSGQVKTLKDLKGRKISVGAKGIILDYYLAKMLESAGLKYQDVEVVSLSYPDGVKALATKAIDAVMAPEPWGVRAEEQKVGKRFFLTESVPSVATFQVAVIMCSGKFAKERPRVAHDFMQAYMKGLKYFHDNGGLKSAEIAGVLSKYTKVPVKDIQASIPFYIDPAARPRAQDLAAVQEWFHQMGWVKQMVPIEKMVDTSFLE